MTTDYTNPARRAEEIAQFNPRHAIEGWLAGYRAYGDTENADLCEAALEIQDSWKKEAGA